MHNFQISDGDLETLAGFASICVSIAVFLIYF